MALVKQSIDSPEANMPTMSHTNIWISGNEQGSTSVFQVADGSGTLRKGGLWCRMVAGDGSAEGTQNAHFCTQSITHQLKTMSSGGIYFEVYIQNTNIGGSLYQGGQVGLVAHGSRNTIGASGLEIERFSTSFVVQIANSTSAKSNLYHDWVHINQTGGGYLGASAGESFGQGDVMNWAIRYDGKVFLGKNGTWVSNGQGTGNPATGANQLATLRIDPDNEGQSMYHYIPACGWHSGHEFHWNFGSDGSFDGNKTSGNHTDNNSEGNFFSSVPSGYVRLCSKNIGDTVQVGYNTYNIAPTVTDNDVSDHFGLKPNLIGDGSNPRTFNHGMDFTPDMILAKGDNKSGSGNDGAFHMYNRIDGTGGNPGSELRLDRFYGENTNGLGYGDITEVTSTTLKVEGSSNSNNFNDSGVNNRFFMWNMGGQPTATNNNPYQTFNTANSGYGSATQVVTVAGGVFVLSPGTGASGTQNNPALTMVRSINTTDASRTVEYIFNQDDASNNGHPLAIKDAAGNNYTTGVVYEIGGSSVSYSNWSNTTTFNGGAGNRKLKFTIDVNAPNTGLRYYCTVHGNGMGNTITTVEGNTMDNNSVIKDGVLQTNYIPPGAPWHYPKRMSINTKAGMSCVRYVGLTGSGYGTSITVPHGLGTRPHMIWIKRLDLQGSSDDWYMYHHKIMEGNNLHSGRWNPMDVSSFSNTIGKQQETTWPATRSLSLSAASNSVDDAVANTAIWDSTPGRHVVRLEANNNSTSLSNRVGGEYMMWSFVEVPGFSMFGRYEANAHAQGMLNPFVYCGFKPQFIMTKKYYNVSNSVSEWNLFDYTDEANPKNYYMGWRDANTTQYQNGAIGSGGNNLGHVYSNGFKIKSWQSGTAQRGNGGHNDTQGNDFIFIAFAKSPFKYSNAVGSVGLWPNI